MYVYSSGLSSNHLNSIMLSDRSNASSSPSRRQDLSIIITNDYIYTTGKFRYMHNARVRYRLHNNTSLSHSEKFCRTPLAPFYAMRITRFSFSLTFKWLLSVVPSDIAVGWYSYGWLEQNYRRVSKLRRRFFFLLFLPSLCYTYTTLCKYYTCPMQCNSPFASCH